MKKLILLILLFVFSDLAGAGEYYYLATFDMFQDGYSVHVSIKKIDLENKLISDSLALRSDGYLATKKPIKLMIEKQNCLLVIIQSGVFSKNSGPGPETTYAYIVDEKLKLKKSIKIPDSNISVADQFEGENGFRFGSTRYADTTYLYEDGIYTIDSDYVFTKIGDYVSSIGPEDICQFGGLSYIHKLNGNNNSIFYNLSDSGYVILKLNIPDSLIISSISTMAPKGSEIFAYHSTQNKIYVFHLNYEQHGKFPEYEKNYGEDWIVPEVLIYDPSSFRLIERHSIADFTPGNYPLVERGQADIVGDYIVYFFFREEHYTRYDPAMLFIFDTRTNEATWLRVGWR